MKRKLLFSKPYEWYWIKKISMPVKFPFGDFVWSGVYGFQIGNTFIGIIRGHKKGTDE